MNTSYGLIHSDQVINITLLCFDVNVTSSYEQTTDISGVRNITLLCQEYHKNGNRDKAIAMKADSSNNKNIKEKTFVGPPKLDTTTYFYGSYDPKIGIRTGLVLTGFLFLLIAYTLYKTKCKRSRWSWDDKKDIDRYSKVLADKWSGRSTKVLNRQDTISASAARSKTAKPSIDETAKWIQSQPLHEVSLISKWTLQDKMYNICMESLKTTACPVCSVGNLSANANANHSAGLTPQAPYGVRHGVNTNQTTIPASLSDTNIINLENSHIHNAQNHNVNKGLLLPQTGNHQMGLKKADNNKVMLPKVSNHVDQNLMHNSVINTLKTLDTEFLFSNKDRELEDSNSDHNTAAKLYELPNLSDNKPFMTDLSLAHPNSSESEQSNDILSPVTLETCSQDSCDCDILPPHRTKCTNRGDLPSSNKKAAQVNNSQDICSNTYASGTDIKSIRFNVQQQQQHSNKENTGESAVTVHPNLNSAFHKMLEEKGSGDHERIWSHLDAEGSSACDVSLSMVGLHHASDTGTDSSEEYKQCINSTLC